MRRTLHISTWPAACVLAFAICAIFTACGWGIGGLAVPTATPVVYEYFGSIEYEVPPSLDDQIFRSKVIARASLKSATSTTESVPSRDEGVAPTFRPVQELRFTVHEYLKGTGPSEVLVVVRDDHTYLTAAEALADAKQTVSDRVTTWDDRQAVIFLEDPWEPYPAGGASGSAATNAFAFNYTSLHRPRSEYSIETLSRSWMPAANTATTTVAAQSSGSATFITDGAKSPHPTITLAEIKAAIAKMAATLKAGEGIEGYKGCIESKLARERIKRADLQAGIIFRPGQYRKTFVSSSASGTEAFRKWHPGHLRAPRYNHYWPSGPDAAHFQATIVDDDTSAENGYHYTLSTARPLPSRVYIVRLNTQHSGNIPCDFKPLDAYKVVTVTVTAPAGTLHEAFFDPIYATSSGEYRADASNGVLKPTAYRRAGDTATTTIRSIAWKAQQATLTTGPLPLPPENHHIDFIALDGSVKLRLDIEDATRGETVGAYSYSWGVCAQPWKAGDLLMLRIAQSPNNLTGATNDTSCATPTPTPPAHRPLPRVRPSPPRRRQSQRQRLSQPARLRPRRRPRRHGCQASRSRPPAEAASRLAGNRGRALRSTSWTT